MYSVHVYSTCTESHLGLVHDAPHMHSDSLSVVEWFQLLVGGTRQPTPTFLANPRRGDRLKVHHSTAESVDSLRTLFNNQLVM